MKIRTRLTLWYATILIVSLALIGASAFNEIAEQMEHEHLRHLWEDAPQQPVKVVALVGESPTRRIGRFTTERSGACRPARRRGE